VSASGGIPASKSPLEPLRKLAGPVQQAVVAVVMEGDEGQGVGETEAVSDAAGQNPLNL